MSTTQEPNVQAAVDAVLDADAVIHAVANLVDRSRHRDVPAALHRIPGVTQLLVGVAEAASALAAGLSRAGVIVEVDPEVRSGTCVNHRGTVAVLEGNPAAATLHRCVNVGEKDGEFFATETNAETVLSVPQGTTGIG